VFEFNVTLNLTQFEEPQHTPDRPVLVSVQVVSDAAVKFTLKFGAVHCCAIAEFRNKNFKNIIRVNFFILFLFYFSYSEISFTFKFISTVAEHVIPIGEKPMPLTIKNVHEFD
jgi:hypothetical protein